MLNNIVDKCEQCLQQNIVQSCFYQHCNKLFISGHVDVGGWPIMISNALCDPSILLN